MNHLGYVLLLHGFGGGIHEVTPLAKRLEVEGYRVYCPILAGHDKIPEKLKKVKYKQWIKSAEGSLSRIGVDPAEVVVIGFSMGGLLAAQLSRTYRFRAVVTINTPVDFWNLPQVGKNLMQDLCSRSTRNVRRYLAAKRRSPFKAMLQFRMLLEDTKKYFSRIHCPVLVIQTLDDDTVGMKSPEFIYRNVSSKERAIAYFEHGGHGVLRSPWAVPVMDKVVKWLADMAQGGGERFGDTSI